MLYKTKIKLRVVRTPALAFLRFFYENCFDINVLIFKIVRNFFSSEKYQILNKLGMLNWEFTENSTLLPLYNIQNN